MLRSPKQQQAAAAPPPHPELSPQDRGERVGCVLLRWMGQGLSKTQMLPPAEPLTSHLNLRNPLYLRVRKDSRNRLLFPECLFGVRLERKDDCLFRTGGRVSAELGSRPGKVTRLVRRGGSGCDLPTP